MAVALPSPQVHSILWMGALTLPWMVTPRPTTTGGSRVSFAPGSGGPAMCTTTAASRVFPAWVNTCTLTVYVPRRA